MNYLVNFRPVSTLDEARALLKKLAESGIHPDAVSKQLETEGVQKFITPYDKLLERLNQRRLELVKQVDADL